MLRLAVAFLIAATPAIAATPIATGGLKVSLTIAGAAHGVGSVRTGTSAQLQQAPSRTFVDCNEGSCVKVIYY